MNGTLQIAVDLEEGEVRLGSERVRLLPGRGDAFYLINRRGPMVRALRFEERSLLLNTNAANGDVAALIADAAFVSSGVCVDQVRVAVSLALAGGGEEAPSFSECARLVEESAGWNPEQVSGTMALVIDRLCGSMKTSQNGWERIVFQEDEADLETLISRMAANLAQRAVPSAPVAQSEAEAQTTTKQIKRTQNKLTTTKPQRDWPATHQTSSTSVNRSVQFERENTEPLRPPVFKSVSSVSSVVPERSVKRIPARVLAPISVNTNQTNPIVAFSRTAPHVEPTEEVAVAQSNQSNFSITQTAPVVFEQPLLTSPKSIGWQQFKPPSSKSQPTQLPAQTETRFSSSTNESPSFDDWLSELATLLEAECDMRGIDP
ncbi:MAG TPA: hypothetical protein VFZ22_21980 [Pyrinomonadaceae bacterium]|nr:hypothetical protein [Pyrinomonadaceae bacterium]